MIGIVVDSNSQMPPDLAARHGIVVVPLTVTIDGVDYQEGGDLDADAFYGMWTEEHEPKVETSQPSPGSFVDAYSLLADRGVTEIVSIHVAEAMSGTLNSARLATQMVDVPVRLVDTGTASFGVSCCAWLAAEAVEAGATVEQAAALAETRAARLRTSFVVGVPRLIDRSGRAAALAVEGAAADGIPVIAMAGSDLSVLTTASDLEGAVRAMVDDALDWPSSDGDGLRIAIGTSDASSAPMSAALTDELAGNPRVVEVLQYRIGPSIGAHTGPGTSGLFVF